MSFTSLIQCPSEVAFALWNFVQCCRCHQPSCVTKRSTALMLYCGGPCREGFRGCFARLLTMAGTQVCQRVGTCGA